MSFGGFTEDDQAKIAEEVHGRVRAKRTGLGFGGATPEASSDTPAPSSNNSSSWFHQRAESATLDASNDTNHDTTEGAFPWDGGHRGKAGSMARIKDQRRETSMSSAQANRGKSITKEREFPMVRDRDIEQSEVRRNEKSQRGARSRSLDRNRRARKGRSRSRSRSRSRNRNRNRGRSRSRSISRNRSRSRSRSRSRERERHLRPARRWEGRQRETRDRGETRDRERSRPRSRERDGDTRQRKRDRFALDTSVRANFDRYDHERRSGSNRGRHACSSTVETEKKPQKPPPAKEPTAEQAKAAVKRRLRQVVAGDVTLKTGFKAALGGGGGWERAEMSEAAEFFKSDEIAAQGGVASVAPEFQARLAEILAVEDEDTMCLGEGMQKTLAAVDTVSGTTGLDHSARMHHEAIFAPTGSVLSQPIASATSAATPSPADVPPKSALVRRVGAAGVMGAAARARLAMAGKLDEVSTMKPRSTPTTGVAKTTTRRIETRPSTHEDDGEKPLFKTLQAAESVEAHYTADDKWYAAIILQVIHGGFDIARYKVRYCEYGNEETLSWRRIRRPEATTRSSPPAVPSAPEPDVSSPDKAPMSSEPVANADASKPFAGMRPRSLCVDKTDAPKEPTVKRDDRSQDSVAVDVVNPDVLSVSSGRKLSWKEKLHARKAKAGASGRPVDGAHGICILPKKQVSLLPDFAAQRREQEGENLLDKSEWRSKVVFGMGSSKRSNV